MRQILSVAMAVVVAIGLAGCTGTAMGSSGESCNGCSYSYVPNGKQTNRKAICMKDGRIFDCSKNPPECPECAAKAAEKK